MKQNIRVIGKLDFGFIIFVFNFCLSQSGIPTSGACVMVCMVVFPEEMNEEVKGARKEKEEAQSVVLEENPNPGLLLSMAHSHSRR